MVDLALVILAGASLCGSIAVAYAIWRANTAQVRQQKELVGRQVAIASARLILDMWEKFQDDDISAAHYIVANHESFEHPEDRTRLRAEYLSQLASVTALYYDGILTENHVMSYFGGVLNDLGAHKETVEYLWDPKRHTYYWPIRKWLDEKTGHPVPKSS